MGKEYIDQELYNKIMQSMKQSGVALMVFEVAKKMDMNLPKLFYEKILKSKNSNDKMTFVNNLMGIYGNYFATIYYKSQKFNVQTEIPLYDENKKLNLKADIGFVDTDGMQNYCEVKASRYIGDVTSYYDSEDERENFAISNKDFLKYFKIGLKLIKQVEKLTKYGKVTVVILKGCKISKDVIERLQDLNVEIKTLAIDVFDLEEFINDIIEKTLTRLNKKDVNLQRKIK